MSPDPARWIDTQGLTLEPLLDLRIVVAGYGNQGRAQALNLRDSLSAAGGGAQGAAPSGTPDGVAVWARPAGSSAHQARADGFTVLSDEALGACDLIVCLLPDECHARFVADVAGPALRARQAREGAAPHTALCFAHGYSLVHSPVGAWIRSEPWGDSVLVAPCGPGADVRARFCRGEGVPGYLAVWEDRSGSARRLALALAHALGLTRAGVIETSVADEVAVDLFGEQSIVCGGLTALMRAAVDTLVHAGYSREMAYLECVQQVALTAEMIKRHGIGGMRERISRTALFGDLVQGPRIINDQVRAQLAEILHEIESGQFARRWESEIDRGSPTISRWKQERFGDPIERMGDEVRGRGGRSKPIDSSQRLD